jgi:hypothetical protein
MSNRLEAIFEELRLVQASESSDSIGLDAFRRNGPNRLSG